MKKVIDRIAELKIIPVVELDRVEDAIPLASALIKGGIPVAEITFRTPSAAEAIETIANAFPDMLIGAGTVQNPRQAEEAIIAGASFIVSPGFDIATARYCAEKEIPIFPGCVTASEVQQAVNMGLRYIKFFPAEQSGGLKTIKALSAPFSQVNWIPTGGISLINIKNYLSFEKVIACGGSFIANKADIEAKNWDQITAISRKTIQIIRNKPEPKKQCAPLFEKTENTYDVVTMGEVLMRMVALPEHRIIDTNSFTVYIGGSELNVGSGTARLGLKTGILTCLPDNDIGKYACREIRRMGLNDEFISYDSSKSARLGLYYYEGGAAPRKPKVVYDRSNSSIYALNLYRLPESAYSATRLFHTSGITLALSNITDTAIEAIKHFKAGGALISFDVNYRANLWDERTAYSVLNNIFPLIDILFISEETSRKMFQKTGSIEDIMRSYHSEYGVRIVATTERKVINSKEHSWNSRIYSAAKDEFFTDSPYDSIAVIDRIGSGDAYDAGVLYGLLEKGTERDMVLYGNAMAALKCTIAGDLPDVEKDEVEKMIATHKRNDQSEMIR